MTDSRKASLKQANDGFTLVELLVALFIGGIVLSVLASVFFTVTGTQNRVVQSSIAASEIQSVAASIRSGIRNSTAFSLDSQSQLLTATTLSQDAASTTLCRAWWYNQTNNSVYEAYGPDAASLPDTTSTSGWVLLSDNITAFAGIPVFSATDNTVEYSMKTSNFKGTITEIKSSISPLNPLGESAPCF